MIFLTIIGSCKKQDEIKQDLVKPKMAVIENAIFQYSYNCSRYPNSFEELLAPPSELEKKWKGPYLLKKQLYDPWGNLYIYEPNSVNPSDYKLISYGADGKPGGEGKNKDIYND